ncbi:DUF4864 domain-containing protein [Mesorhizobium sp. ANAO-SY3R2]|uniref:DUF4864 domain-containing protein n=1 Tax=Mesorhizobium sp. ANAO-SY3R2 TaxID=3166644 RepID=UPI00367327B4
MSQNGPALSSQCFCFPATRISSTALQPRRPMLVMVHYGVSQFRDPSGDARMHRAAIAFAVLLFASPTIAGDADIRSAQDSISGQLQAFRSGNNAGAYGYAAPNLKRIFPTLDAFMDMVAAAYRPVRHPQSFSFGKSRQTGASAIVQQVLIVGQDGKDYEAVYSLELQPDGVWRITGVRLRAANSQST